MGVRGLYTYLRNYGEPVAPETENPLCIGVDTYSILYFFREDIDAAFSFLETFVVSGHSFLFVMDGTPPIEKAEEILQRKSVRRQALTQAAALRAFLEDSTAANSLTAESKKVLEARIEVCEKEGWTVYRELREKFLARLTERGMRHIQAEGEADDALIALAKKGEVDVVISNDMDLLVGGVERLWILKKAEGFVLKEFHRSRITKALGIRPECWPDVAILAGYEKCPQLRCCSVNVAISWLRHYGSMEQIAARRPELLSGRRLEDIQKARAFFGAASDLTA